MDELLDYLNPSYKPDPNKPILSVKAFKFKLQGEEYVFYKEEDAKAFQLGWKDSCSGDVSAFGCDAYFKGVDAQRSQK